MKKELWLFTIRFPFGNGESFLENELPILARGFERIILFPLMPEGAARTVPVNVEVIQLFSGDAYASASPLRVLFDLHRWNSVMRMARASAPSRMVFTDHRRSVMSRLRQALHREQALRSNMAERYDPERVVLYSYWTSDWATVLGLWKLKDARVHAVSRMHGFDLYDHRAVANWQVFQSFHVRQMDHVFVASRAGLQHLKQRFPEAATKFSVQHMATNDHGIGPWSPSDELRIVSCANLIPLKRVHLLAEALMFLDIPVQWTHFGDGAEHGRIKALIARMPGHIQVDLRGNVPNTEILNWYKTHTVDVFVHTSETEGGAPVALQEAASFGIPLLAADAGGVNEIVTTSSGDLLPHDLSPAALAERLRAFRTSRWYSAEQRAQVRNFWKNNFEAEQVHGRLLQQLLQG